MNNALAPLSNEPKKSGVTLSSVVIVEIRDDDDAVNAFRSWMNASGTWGFGVALGARGPGYYRRAFIANEADQVRAALAHLGIEFTEVS